MKCETFEPLLALHVEGDLPAEQAAGVERHLGECAACRAFAAELAQSQAALKDLADDELDPTALAAVRRYVNERLDEDAARWTAYLRPWLVAAAAVALVMGGAVVLPRLLEDTSPTTAAVVGDPPLAPGPRPALATAAPTPPLQKTVATAAAPPRAAAKPPVRRAARITLEPPLPVAPDAEPGTAPPPPVVKLVTNDPDVVIYWIAEPNGGES